MKQPAPPCGHTQQRAGRRTVARVCEYCVTAFLAYRGHVNAGRAKFCSMKCSALSRKKDPAEISAAAVARVSAWRKTNLDRVRANRRNRYKTDGGITLARNRAWSAANPLKMRAGRKAWNKANPDAQAEIWRNRRARKKGAAGTHTKKDVADIRQLQRDRCAICQIALRGKGHVDHIIALAAGGANDRRNLQLLCKSCNSSKGDRDPIEFSQSRGLLL